MPGPDWTHDPVVRELRSEIAEADRSMLETLNRRIELVARLRAYKESQGYPFVDLARESAMLDELTRANRGPLSTDGLRRFYAGLLDLTKREVTSDGSFASGSGD